MNLAILILKPGKSIRTRASGSLSTISFLQNFMFFKIDFRLTITSKNPCNYDPYNVLPGHPLPFIKSPPQHLNCAS